MHVCGGYDYTAETAVGEVNQQIAPLVFPNPASSMGRVFASFEQSTDWALVNAMGQTLDRGRAAAGTRVVWQSLAPGMYVVQTNSGATPLVVSH